MVQVIFYARVSDERKARGDEHWAVQYGIIRQLSVGDEWRADESVSRKGAVSELDKDSKEVTT